MTRLVAVMMLGTLLGCGARAPLEQVVERPCLTLARLLPANADYVVYVQPANALGGTLGEALAPLLPPEDREVVGRRLGGDVGALDEAAYAEIEGRALYLARGPQAAAMFAHLKERMVPVESSSEGPVSRAAGVIGLTRYELALTGDVIIGAQSLVDLSAALAQIENAASPLFDGVQNAPIAVVVPTPLELPANTGVGVLMARHRSIRITATPADEQLTLEAKVVGEFPDGAEQNFRQWFESVAESGLGSALGLREGAAELSVTRDAEAMHLRTRVGAVRFGRGLADVLGAEVRSIRGEQ